MAKDDELVKIITKGSANPKAAAASAGLGLLAGAAGAVAALRKRSKVVDLNEAEDSDSDSKDQLGAFDRDAVGITTDKEKKGVKNKLLTLAEHRGWHWVGRVLQVQRRFGELHGNNVAAAVTLQIFLSIFPLFLVAAAVIGFIANDNPGEVSDRLVSSLGLTGEAAETMKEAVGTATESKSASSIIGLATLAWSALGVTSALQFAYNQAWQSGGRGVKDKAVGLAWLAGAGFLFAATAVVTTLINFLPAGLGVLATVAGLGLNFALWMFTGRVLPNVNIPWKALIPGAIVGVIGLELLKLAGGIWVPRAVESSSALYGALGVLLAVLAWMLLFGKLVMYSAVVNVIAYESKYGTESESIEMPRASAESASDVTRSGSADS